MKLNPMKWAILLLVCGSLLAGCADKESNDSPLPDTQTVNAFNAQFPTATDVSWTKKKGYDVASFTLPASRAAATGNNSAWYSEGTAICSYTKLEISFDALKQQAPAVAQAWEASQYKKDGYTLDEISVKTYAEATPTYKLEIERADAEIELIYNQDGSLLSERPDIDTDDDNDEDEPCPTQILAFITKHLPQAVIVETDYNDYDGIAYYEVTVRVGNEERDLCFTTEGEFRFAVREVDEAEYATALPKAVYDKFLVLASDVEEWEEVMIQSDIQGAVLAYVLVVEDEQTDQERIYRVDAQGNEIS